MAQPCNFEDRFIDDTSRYSDIVIYDTILQSCGRFVNVLTMGDVQILYPMTRLFNHTDGHIDYSSISTDIEIFQ
ncbi:12025_t:CDS:1, partial [Entrophospora sp. SA101]